jgi:hypothetical protein
MAGFHELVFKRTNSYLSRESTKVSFSHAIENMAASVSRAGQRLRASCEFQDRLYYQ